MAVTPAELVQVVETVISNPLVQQAVLPALESVWKKFGAPKVAKGYGHLLYKSMDAAIAAIVQHVPDQKEAEALTAALIARVRAAATQIGDCASAYAPLQVAVEAAKAAHGDKSAEAQAARAARKQWELKQNTEVQDALNTLLGGG